MHKKCVASCVSVLVCIVLMMLSVLPAVALDNKYEMDELGMSIKIPKEYYVITRESTEQDAVFADLGLDYNDTMTAFSAADIYLQAISEDRLLKVTLSMNSNENSKAINNYSQLTEAQRQTALDTFLSDSTYTSGKMIKHNGIIFFDLELLQKSQDMTIYGYQCHTVVNGMDINLTLQKGDEQLTADEIKVVTNIANSIDFDKIIDNKGIELDWWRILLWIVIIVALAFATQYLYKQYAKSSQEKLLKYRERRAQRDISKMSDEEVILASVKDDAPPEKSKDALMHELGFDTDDEITAEGFDRLLGYDTTEYSARTSTDVDSFDVSVKEKDLSHGVKYFEDSGDSINDRPDYFDSYFSEQEEKRSIITKVLSAIKMYAKHAVIHIGYFVTNLGRMLRKSVKNKIKRR